ncbi:TPA: terminase small subunit [Serratia marcescens]
MLTAQKRKFALALMSGSNQTASAIKAGYSEKSARSKGSQLANDPEVIAFIERKKNEKVEVDEYPASRRDVNTSAVNTNQDNSQRAVHYDDPIEYLKAVMNGLEPDDIGRRDAAKAMLPYMHPKKGESGKKDARNAAAKVAATVSKFGAMAPPKLVVNNKG